MQPVTRSGSFDMRRGPFVLESNGDFEPQASVLESQRSRAPQMVSTVAWVMAEAATRRS
jgi:hypothetical protein